MATNDVLTRLTALEKSNRQLARKLRRRGQMELVACILVACAASLGLATPDPGLEERIEVLEDKFSGKSEITLTNQTGSKLLRLSPEGIYLKGSGNREAKLRPSGLRMDTPEGTALLFFHKGEPAVGLKPRGAEFYRFLKYGMLRH